MDNELKKKQTEQSAATAEAFVRLCAVCLMPLGEDDDEFCSQEGREVWWTEYNRDNVRVVA